MARSRPRIRLTWLQAAIFASTKSKSVLSMSKRTAVMVRGVGGMIMVWVSASLVCEWFGASRVMGCVRGRVFVRVIVACFGYGAWFAGVPLTPSPSFPRNSDRDPQEAWIGSRSPCQADGKPPVRTRL